ncbi:LysR family transcriptional regulator [Noviherbaspirillum galbum]|uniref:LysR family transcriptional regulator n=1 Tax=Noviherbaspirillum galbum TaxID=2709383 RepID=A0A6B3SZ91_9BURK|nr:LysR family transcriptional regulator [Noviherbaspirillum galbum]NEX63809.1 LysR family transcriptional regulator [Noviherbaspirillum galbum]
MEASLRQLQHLVVLAEEMSFARAAQKVNLSQPALSRSIQALERDLDIALLDRAARRVTLTAAGRQVLERARRVLFEARCLKRDVDLIRQHALGEVSFGVGPHSAAIFLADMLIALRKEHPGLHVRPEVNSWDVLHDKLQKEAIDFFVTDLGSVPSSDALSVRRLPPLPTGWFVRKGHPLLRRPRLSIGDFSPYAFAFVPLPAALLRKVRHALSLPEGEALHRLVECNNFDVLKTLAAQSDVVLYASEAAVRREVRAGSLQPLETAPDPAPPLVLAAVRLARRTLSPEAEIAIGAMNGIIAAFADGAARPPGKRRAGG